MEYDLIVRNGMLVDGTGLPRRRVDVGVRDGKIVRLARLECASAREEIDAKGRIVAPGIALGLVAPNTGSDSRVEVLVTVSEFR